MQKGRVMIIPSTFRLMKKSIVLIQKMSQYFPKLYERSSGNIKATSDIFNQAINANLKGRQMLIHLVQK